VSFTKTTARALAAAIAFVIAGGTVAGAAVFHLPILGFGPAPVARTTVAPLTTPTTRKVQPRVVERTRFVDEVVHRPAPRPTLDADVSSAPTEQPRDETAVQPPTTAAPAAPPARVGHESDDEMEHGSAHAHTDGEEADD
jgi:hypothetical protein